MKKKMSISATLGCCALALSCVAGGVQAAPVQAWDINSVSGYSNGSWSFGDVFSVGGNNITVSALGALDVGMNGFATTGGIKVGLFLESSGALLASGNVLSSDQLLGNYRFTDIADIVLLANTQYRVVAVSGSDLYNITEGTPDNIDARITWNRYGYCQTTALTKCDSFTGSERTWMANMLIGSDENNVPEPSPAGLLGIAGLAFWAVRRRKQA